MADSLRRVLEQGDRGGVFFLYGEDEHRKREAAKGLVEAHVDPATRDFNYDVLTASETDVEALASVLATPPMMAEWRVVEVRGTEAFASSAKARELLLGVAGSPPPDLALILITTVPQGSKAKFYSEMSRVARSVEFKAISQDDVPGWLMEEAESRYGKPIALEAARALGQALGTDLGILSQELAKLVVVAGDSSEITLGTVEAAGTTLPRSDRWQWFDLVADRKFGPALEELRILLSHGDTGVGLTIGLTTHFLRLGVAVEDGAASLERILPRHQKWLTKRFRSQARKWSPETVRSAVLGLRRLDRMLKSSPMPAEHHMEEWLLGLMVDGSAAA